MIKSDYVITTVLPEQHAGVVLAVRQRDLGFTGARVRLPNRRGEQHGTVLLTGTQANGLVCNMRETISLASIDTLSRVIIRINSGRATHSVDRYARSVYRWSCRSIRFSRHTSARHRASAKESRVSHRRSRENLTSGRPSLHFSRLYQS